MLSNYRLYSEKAIGTRVRMKGYLIQVSEAVRFRIIIQKSKAIRIELNF